MSVSQELLDALKVTDRAELFLELDPENPGTFFAWARREHSEFIEPTPAWESLRQYIVRTGHVPDGIRVRGVPNADHDAWFLQQTEPTKEEGHGPVQ